MGRVVAFAHQSTYGGGVGLLPAWFRSLPRVQRWVGAKLILLHAKRLDRRLEECAETQEIVTVAALMGRGAERSRR
jgi:hypothetical protein